MVKREVTRVNEVTLYARNMHLSEKVESCSGSCILCKRGNAKKIVKCKAHWCYAHADRYRETPVKEKEENVTTLA